VVELPFRIEHPVATQFFCLAVTGVLALLVWSFDQKNKIGRLLAWAFERRFDISGQERARTLGRSLLAAFMWLFAAMSAFGIFVNSGLIKNGDPPPRVTIDQFLRQHR
jgi:hypothetical protein